MSANIETNEKNEDDSVDDASSVSSEDLPEELPPDTVAQPTDAEVKKRLQKRRREALQKGFSKNAAACGITKASKTSFGKDQLQGVLSKTCVKKLAKFCPENAAEVATPPALWKETCELSHTLLGTKAIEALAPYAEAFKRNLYADAQSHMMNCGDAKLTPWHLKCATSKLVGVLRNDDFLLPRGIVRNAQNCTVTKKGEEVPMVRMDEDDLTIIADEKQSGRDRKEIYKEASKAALAAKEERRRKSTMETEAEGEASVSVVA